MDNFEKHNSQKDSITGVKIRLVTNEEKVIILGKVRRNIKTDERE